MKAVILAGGLGSRLRPFTEVIPKPLLPLGDKALIEVQILRLKECGFNEIYIAINYKSEYVISYLGDGSKFGVKIHYSKEEKPLGTAGPVKLLENELTEPFLLMNGDILTKLNFSDIYNFSVEYPNSPLTIGTKIITTPFRFGNIYSDGVYVKKVEEKPELNFEILAGIYMMKPSVFDFIPKNEYFGIDLLIKELLAHEVPVTKYLIKDYWLDIGIVEDYEQARKIYSEEFEKNRNE